MNSKALFILLFIVLLQASHTEAALDGTVEVRVGAFFPANKHFRKLYGDVLPSYQIEFGSASCGCFDFWANFEYFGRSGHAGHHCCKTRADIFNGGVGVKWAYTWCNGLTTYLGAGPVLGQIWLKNKTCMGSGHHHKKSKGMIGGLFKSGVYYYFCDNIFLDLFVDYLYEPVKFDRRVNLGGFRTGAGIGFAF